MAAPARTVWDSTSQSTSWGWTGLWPLCPHSVLTKTRGVCACVWVPRPLPPQGAEPGPPLRGFPRQLQNLCLPGAWGTRPSFLQAWPTGEGEPGAPLRAHFISGSALAGGIQGSFVALVIGERECAPLAGGKGIWGRAGGKEGKAVPTATPMTRLASSQPPRCLEPSFARAAASLSLVFYVIFVTFIFLYR